MERKDIFVELEKVKSMVEKKLQKDGCFPAFAIAYTAESNRMLQLDGWETDEERAEQITKAVDWLKSKQPYMIAFGSLSTRRKYKTQEDYQNDTNYEMVDGIVILAQTPDKRYNYFIEYTTENGKYLFKEELVNMTNEADESFLDDVYKGIN
jgi:hypothetical protein